MNPFEDLNKIVSGGLATGYKPMTDTEFHLSNLTDILDWAEALAGSWNGDEPGYLEYCAIQAQEVILKVQELQELLKEIERS